eukprot:533208-Pelagomonas_calceolata.AAC.1
MHSFTKNHEHGHISTRATDAATLHDPLCAFGVVYKARDKNTGLEFCCKSIRKELLTPEVFDDIK